MGHDFGEIEPGGEIVMYRLQQFVWDAIPCRNEVVPGRLGGQRKKLIHRLKWVAFGGLFGTDVLRTPKAHRAGGHRRDGATGGAGYRFTRLSAGSA